MKDFFARFSKRFTQSMSFEPSAKFRTNPDENISHEEVIKFSKSYTELLQSLWAIAIRTAASNSKSKKDLSANIKPFDNVTLKMLGGMFSANMALRTRAWMEESGYNKQQVTIGVSFVDLMCRLPSEVQGQENTIKGMIAEEKQSGKLTRKDGKPLRLPSKAELTKSTSLASPLFWWRSYLLWLATNDKELSFFEKAVRTAIANGLVATPLVSVGTNFGRYYNQEAEKQIGKAFKMSFEKLGWVDVFAPQKELSFKEFNKALGMAVRKSYVGILGTSFATGLAAIILSDEFHEMLVDGLVPEASKFLIKLDKSLPDNKNNIEKPRKINTKEADIPQSSARQPQLDNSQNQQNKSNSRSKQ